VNRAEIVDALRRLTHKQFVEPIHEAVGTRCPGQILGPSNGQIRGY
jgi:hypothetical protein